MEIADLKFIYPFDYSRDGDLCKWGLLGKPYDPEEGEDSDNDQGEANVNGNESVADEEAVSASEEDFSLSEEVQMMKMMGLPLSFGSDSKTTQVSC